VQCALELVDLALTPNHPDYQILVATRDREVIGYVCYGPTPMTENTFDLYWIASDPKARGQGVGASLVAGMILNCNVISFLLVALSLLAGWLMR
jgi:predicted N-acetyltransferase YhbS